MIKSVWIYENHMCELQSEELNEGWSSQLYTQLRNATDAVAKKKPEKNLGLLTIPSYKPIACLQVNFA